MITAACSLLSNMHKHTPFACLLILLLSASCAQIVAPTGGDRDLIPPRVLGVSPETRSTHFSSRKIVVEFDEFIQLNTPEDLIIISPPTETKPVYTNKGKQLEIKLTSPLNPNTTYTINFSTAVGDNKENNLVRDYNYVFSTGPELDSGFISGHVSQSFTNKPEKDITVALYYPDSFNDSTIIKQKPVYLARTDEAGNFRISNLPSEQFVIVAFRDENKNLKSETSEELGFTDQPVQFSDTSSKPLELRLFRSDQYLPGQLVDTFSREPDKFVFVVHKPSAFDIRNLNGNPLYTMHFKGSQGTDTFTVFSKMNPADTGGYFNLNGQVIPIPYKPALKPRKLSFSFNKQPELKDTIVFRFNNPVVLTDTSRLKLFRDSFRIQPVLIPVDAFEYRLFYPWEEKTSYRLDISDSAFKDHYDQYSRKDRSLFTSKSQKDYATLLLHVKTGRVNGQVILQLVDEAETRVAYEFILHRSADISIDYVLPGSYKIKYIYDTNSNGKWDNGDFRRKKQPEQVGYFKESINIKAYWDLEQSILIE